MRLAFVTEYDGTNFSGFQKQKNAISVQEAIEDALKEITKQEISINYAGRTDAGVHALSQVFDFSTEINRSESDWLNGINSNLPNSIQVKDVINVPEEFGVCGFNDIEMAAFAEPSLTTVRVNRYSMGAKAMELIFEKNLPQDESESKTSGYINTGFELVMRNSTR